MILADVESCVAAFVNEGEAKLTKAIEMNKYFRERIWRLQNVRVVDFEEQGLRYDPTKTVLSIDGLDGETLYNNLIDKY